MRLRAFKAFVCLVLFLGLQPFVASPALHQAVHPDAGSANHHCAFTLIATGQVLLAAAAGLSLVCLGICLALPAVPALEFPASFDYRLSPSRASPVSL
ncbi:MAG: hypothetical protein U1F98_17410 [Verrucomicrobiota bacterium]